MPHFEWKGWEITFREFSNHHASKNSPLFPSYPMLKKVNSSLRQMGKIHFKNKDTCMKKKQKQLYLLLINTPFLSVVYQYRFSEVRLIFWAPLVLFGALIVSVAEATCRHEPVVMGRHLVWCGDSGVPDSFTQLPLFIFWGSTERGMGSYSWRSYGGLHLNSPERRHSVYWTASRKATLRKAAVKDSV